MSILNWDGQAFTGEMAYPDRGHVTRVSGQVDGDRVTWTEMAYKKKGTGRDVELGGTYRAVLVSGETMRGEWYRTGVEFLGSFEMTATRSSG